MLVCALLANHTSLAFAAVVLLTFVTYVAWTVALTKASVAIRKEVRRGGEGEEGGTGKERGPATSLQLVSGRGAVCLGSEQQRPPPDKQTGRKEGKKASKQCEVQ